MGVCRYGTACKFSHELTSVPSASVVAGGKARLRTREEILQSIREQSLEELGH